jgi:hypothetical protein
MLAISYADVVGTLGLVLALFGIWWQWWVRRTEPEQTIRVKDAIQRHDARTVFLPKLRSRVLGAMQFIDEPEGWRPVGVLAQKCLVRFNDLYTDWEENRHLVRDADVQTRMRELTILEEIRWLEVLTTADLEAQEDEIHTRLLGVKVRLQSVLDAVEGSN